VENGNTLYKAAFTGDEPLFLMEASAVSPCIIDVISLPLLFWIVKDMEGGDGVFLGEVCDDATVTTGLT
jgi:hypothetical protein